MNKKIKTNVIAECNFQNLIENKYFMKKKEYCKKLRVTYIMKTSGTPIEVLMKAFDGISKKNIMTFHELWTYYKMPKMITIYRGASREEEKPRMSWSLSKKIALQYCKGKMFIAQIPKKDIIAYFQTGHKEEEVLAYITEDYDVYFID